MPKIVFWNVHRKDLTDHVCQLAEATQADVIVLNENLVTIDQTLKALKENVSADFYKPNSSPSSERRFHCFCRDRTLDLSEVHSGFRTSFRKLKIGSQHLLIGLVHGVDPRNNDSETRQADAQELASEMQFVKEQQGSNKLILLGDFNMNPYDRGMNLAAGLNAMMTKSCVQSGTRRRHNKNYEFYYNPMWSLFGDNTEGPAGTVYDTSDQGPYGWSMFDQVILNHSVVEMFQDVKILTAAGSLPLMNAKGRPDSKTSSDHFPLLVALQGENND